MAAPPFAALRALHPPATASQLDAYFTEWMAGEWRLLALEAHDAVELANDYDPIDYPPAGKRHQPARRSTAATSTRPDAVKFSTDDPLKQIAPRVYVEALTGETVPDNGMLSCPLADHEDRTPSFQVLNSHWRCFGCNRGEASSTWPRHCTASSRGVRATGSCVIASWSGSSGRRCRVRGSDERAPRT
jgi:hypothetical protein